VYISAKVDYATRTLLTLAEQGTAMTGAALAEAQDLPGKFLENNVLPLLRRGGLVVSHRGSHGGYALGRPASKISVADVIRCVEGPLAEVRGERPEQTYYQGGARHLQDVWVAVRAGLREVLEATTMEDIVTGKLPRPVRRLLNQPDAWLPRPLGPPQR
jgi:Rrf2 family protein